MAIYRDRVDAGRRLAELLTPYTNRQDVLVLALPRGGVPVAFEIARALSAPLDVFVVRKLGVPGQPELAMGAIASGDVRVLNKDVVRALRISEDAIESVAEAERKELRRRDAAYRGEREPLEIKGRMIILVDDGLATGATMKAAVEAVRERQPKQVIVAVPTASPDVVSEFRRIADEVVCAATPTPFHAVGASYDRFEQTTDDEVRDYLSRARRIESMEDADGSQ